MSTNTFGTALPGRLHFSGMRHVPERAGAWLLARPRDVISLSFSPGTPAQNSTQNDAPAAATLSANLAPWQRSITRYRMLALARRWLLAGVVLALLLALCDRFISPLSLWVVIGVPAALAAIATIVLLRRAPSLDTVAHLLDRRLGLKEQVASALDIAEGRATTSNSALAQQLEARAAALVRQAGREWIVQLEPAWWEWLSLALLAVVVALVLSAPRPAPNAGNAAPTSRPIVVPTAVAPAHVALPVPSVPAGTRLPARLNVGVVSTPVPNAAGPSSAARGHSQARHQLTAPTAGHRAQATPAGRTNGTTPTGKLPKSSSGGTGQAPGQNAAGARQQAGQQGSKLPVVTNRQRFLPTTPVAPANGKGRNQPGQANGQAGQAQGAANGRGAASARAGGSSAQKGQRAGANSSSRQGSGSASNTSGRQTSGAPGSQQLPYGGHLPTANQLAKPGLITGKGTFTGKGTPGGTTPGSGRASAQNGAGQRSLPIARGHQLTLQSPYGPSRAGSKASQTNPGGNNGTSGNASRVSGGSSGVQSGDYVPPDANAVAPADRGIVSNYFSQPGKQ